MTADLPDMEEPPHPADKQTAYVASRHAWMADRGLAYGPQGAVWPAKIVTVPDTEPSTPHCPL